MSETGATTDHTDEEFEHGTAPPASPPVGQESVLTPSLRRRPRWVIAAASLVGGLVVGAVIAGVSVAALKDPVKSPEYHALQSRLISAEDESRRAEDQARQANDRAVAASSSAAGAAAAASSSAAQRAAELDQREQALGARESAVSAVEQHIKETSIADGTWTVGTDIEAGTYKTSSPVSGQCYWAIYKSGTNGSDIVENDIVNGGYPTVTLRVGQDFKNDGCGTFVKQ